MRSLTTTDPARRSFGFLLVPDFAMLSYASAIEPLRAANTLAGRELYLWETFATAGMVRASNGTMVAADRVLPVEDTHHDIVFVCAGGNPATFADDRAFAWLRRASRAGVTIGGISGGPFILARAGLLDGRRCTIHWEHIPAFEKSFPGIKLSRSLFVSDRGTITCSGGIATLDMMVSLIARDHGHQLGAAVSEWFLHTQVREGPAPQRMDLRFRSGISNERVLDVLRTMESSVEFPVPRETLAAGAGMSVRQLERIFRSELGRGIHEHYLGLRLARARQLLRETPLSVLEVALETGFSSASQFCRAFHRSFGETPSAASGRVRRRAK